jgi:ABC-type polysaccharide/polyol phosphate transport system ATPase subunit
MIDLKFDNVSKRYRIYREQEGNRPRNALLQKVRRLWARPEDFWALRDINFEVERGEALGIIGHNGAGKSTILKLLFNITTPTRGEITIRGRLAALLEIASGFHPELTGRENIYLNGSLLGMKRSEITRKLQSILDFSEVTQFIDTPVKRYSLGMHLRLGFSIAAHLDPDVLLLDEILAVGDAPFQAKCIDRITGLKKAGKTIVFVSHNLSAIQTLCDRVLLIHHGKVVMSGPPREVIAEYETVLSNLPTTSSDRLLSVPASPPGAVVSLAFFNSAGRRTTIFATGEWARAEVEYVIYEAIPDAVLEVYFYSVFGTLHSHWSTEFGGERLDLRPGKLVLEFSCPEICLEVASFNVEASIKRRGSGFSEHLEYKQVGVVSIMTGRPVHGQFHMPHTWRVKESVESLELTEDPSLSPEMSIDFIRPN